MKCAVQGCKNEANQQNRFNGIIFVNGKKKAVTTYTCNPCYSALTKDSLRAISLGAIDASE